jgi:hypothetical protein
MIRGIIIASCLGLILHSLDKKIDDMIVSAASDEAADTMLVELDHEETE